MPLFSIIIPVYNVERYLRQCLDSVLAQDFTNYECLLVNDGSTDNSQMICEEYCEKNDRFRLINQRNQGLSCARNTGIVAAVGEYIVFLDSDDFIKNSALKNLCDQINKQGAKPDVIVSSTYAYYEKTNECEERAWNPQKSELSAREVLEETFKSKDFVIAAWTLTTRRDYLNSNALLFEPGLLHEDELWYPLVVKKAERIMVNKNPFYCNRCNRNDSITNLPRIKRCYDKLHIIEKLSQTSVKSDCQELFRYRCAQLMTGIIKSYKDYSVADKDKKLHCKIEEDLYILWQSDNFRYRLLYILCRFTGIECVSIFLNRRSR